MDTEATVLGRTKSFSRVARVARVPCPWREGRQLSWRQSPDLVPNDRRERGVMLRRTAARPSGFSPRNPHSRRPRRRRDGRETMRRTPELDGYLSGADVGPTDTRIAVQTNGWRLGAYGDRCQVQGDKRRPRRHGERSEPKLVLNQRRETEPRALEGA